jgi:hypothetical protein
MSEEKLTTAKVSVAKKKALLHHENKCLAS